MLTTLSAVFLAVGIALIPTAAFASNGNSDHSQGNAGTSGTYNQPQPPSKADMNNTGANDTSNSNQYLSTRDGSPSGNGSGVGQASGKPCAGCVGKADNKNPPGQYPNGTIDTNKGYECDGNHGIGQTNPAHTGCKSSSSSSSTSSTTSTTSTTLPKKSTTTSTTLPTAPTVPPSFAPGGGTTTVPGAPVITPARNAPARSAAVAAPVAAPSAAVRTRPAGALAFTGNDATVEALAGVASLGLGLGLMRLARRRRQSAG